MIQAKGSPVAGKIGYAPAPVVKTTTSGWLYAWLKDPKQYWPETAMPGVVGRMRPPLLVPGGPSAEHDPGEQVTRG